MKHKSIILLSTKSSGSSAFQKFLVTNYGVNVVPVTMHHENETLFWTKACSVLSRPQEKMHRSVVPYRTTDAIASLERLLTDNGVTGYEIHPTMHSISSVYRALVVKYGPAFFEKSPHHLFNYSNIELMLAVRDQLKDEIEFDIIGLVRNPLDTIYSAWSRWRYQCVSFEKEWLQSYRHLRQLKKVEPCVTIFTYESLVQDNTILDRYCRSIGLSQISDRYSIKPQSLSKWKKDEHFGHHLSPETIHLAKDYGYSDSELANTRAESWSWKFREVRNAYLYAIKKSFRSMKRKIGRK